MLFCHVVITVCVFGYVCYVYFNKDQRIKHNYKAMCT